MQTVSIVLAALVMLCTACTSVELAPNDGDSSAKSFFAESGKSVVYVVHLGGYGANSRLFQIAVNGQSAGSLTGQTYHRVVLPPGRQRFVARTEESERVLELVTVAGSVDFVGLTSTIGMNTMRVGSFQKLDPPEGRTAVMQAKMARGLK